jgi:crotonobetainyl-CoA:carnitine CoA-transferase CaiB-like acyl-CoA transferase
MADDPRFSHPKSQVANVGALTDMLTETFRSKSSQEWTRKFIADRIPGAPVNNVAEAMAQPIAKLRNMVEELDHPGGEGMLKFLGNPFKYGSSQPLSYPPKRGGETRAVLERVCGYDSDAIDKLIAQGVIYQGEANDATK